MLIVAPKGLGDQPRVVGNDAGNTEVGQLPMARSGPSTVHG